MQRASCHLGSGSSVLLQRLPLGDPRRKDQGVQDSLPTVSFSGVSAARPRAPACLCGLGLSVHVWPLACLVEGEAFPEPGSWKPASSIWPKEKRTDMNSVGVCPDQCHVPREEGQGRCGHPHPPPAPMVTADPGPPHGHCQPGLKSVAQPSWETDPARPGNHTSSLGGREWGQRCLQRDPRVHPRNGDLFSPPCGPSAHLLLCGVRGGRVEPRGESVLCGLHGMENLHRPQGMTLVSHVWSATAWCGGHQSLCPGQSIQATE